MTRGADNSDHPAWPRELLTPLRSLQVAGRVRVALSGGLDSVLLLHLARTVFADHPGGLSAIHVNHQLQACADRFESHCRAVCAALAVPLDVETVTVSGNAGGRAGGVEAAARKARYQVFETRLAPGDLLLMAHHADDQTETLLFRLLRGSGVAGLAGMPARRPLGEGELARPLLEFRRRYLENEARRAGLDWIEDPSNRDPRHDRNYLRHSILPLLESRWPGLDRRLAAVAQSSREARELAEELARIHHQRCGDESGCLRLPDFMALSRTQQKNLLQWWLQQNDCPPLILSDWPGTLAGFTDAVDDGTAEIRGRGFVLRRFRGRIHLLSLRQGSGDLPQSWLTPASPLMWEGRRYRLQASPGRGDSWPQLRVSLRQGGERIRPRPRGPSRPLKKWLQEMALPPWERDRLPLFHDGGELVAVGDLWCHPRYRGEAPDSGWKIVVEHHFN